MSIKYCASMMCADYRNLEKEVHELENAGIDSFHIDIMDGRFVPNFAMSLNDLYCIGTLTRKPMDVHLMVEHPNKPRIPSYHAKPATAPVSHRYKANTSAPPCPD